MNRLLLLVFLAGCTRGGSSSITLAAAGPWKEGYGLMDRRGIELAEAEINALPERKVHPLRVIYKDDESSGEKASHIAQYFVDSTDALGVIGHVTSAPAVAASQVYDGHLAAVATSATSPELTGISKWTFRVISSDAVNGADLARFSTRRGHKRAAILYENDTYGRGLANAFRKAFTGTIISFDPIDDSKDQPFEAYVSYYKLQKPDVIFSAATDASGRPFLREIRRQNLTVDLVGGDGWSGLTVDTTLAEGIYTGVPFTPQDPRPEAQAFVRAFIAKFGLPPDNNAALSYDATKLLYQAAAVGGTRSRVRDYLAALTAETAYHGVTGLIHFRPDGDPVGKGVVMTRLEKGTLRVVEATQ